MALTALDKDAIKPAFVAAWKQVYADYNDPRQFKDPADGKYYETDPNKTGGLYGALTDVRDSQPTFDTAHQVYVPTTMTGTQAAVDNRNGLNPGPVQVTLSYDYEKGATASHTQTKTVTVGVTEEVDLNFEIAESKTTFSFSGSFSWQDGTSTSVTTSIEQAVTVPVSVPTGKVYTAIIYFTQEDLFVPYKMGVTVSGTSHSWVSSTNSTDTMVGSLFDETHDHDLAGDESALYTENPDRSGAFTLSGKADMSDSGGFQVKILDTTPPGGLGSGGVRPSDIGVYRVLGDGGETHRGTLFDDHIEGGAGGDFVMSRGGQDHIYGNGGDDDLRSISNSRAVIHGGEGDDKLSSKGIAAYNELIGGAGDDRIRACSPWSIVDGGEGDDFFHMDDRSHGSRIMDHEGVNRLKLEHDGPIAFEKVGDMLFIHTDGNLAYDPAQDIVWTDFFASDTNKINGISSVAMDLLI